MAKSVYVTKAELKEELSNTEKKIKDYILNSEDKILGELQKMRDDDEVHKFSHVRINEEIEELQTDVSKLKATKIA